MVEGPGVFRNRAKAAAHRGKRVVGLSGARATVVAEAARGRVLVEVLALGKELFLLFASADDGGEGAVRVHFGMSGTCYVDSARPAHYKKLTLQIHFHGAGSALRFCDATCQSCEAPSARAKVAASAARDVCAPAFERAAALAALDANARAAPRRMLADALLDQALLPGCGNIIKTEACARARLDPRRGIASLAASERDAVIGHARQFSLSWAKGARPALLWYDQTICGACGARLRFCKLGDDAERPTFWCAACCEAAVAAAAARSGGDGAASDGDDAVSRFFAPRKRAKVAPPAQPIAPASGCAERFACGAHGAARTSLKRARKRGPNVGRLFFACRVPSCDHFAWADALFPKCSCGGAPARLRVSKRVDSGGRWFFGCGSERRCNFFAWASDAQLEPLGGLLTPLT